MLYKKFAIEAVFNELVVLDSRLISETPYGNDIKLSINNTKVPINIIKYVDDLGILTDFPIKFYTHNHAYNILDRHYDIIFNNYNIRSVKIVEIYDNIEPPLIFMRLLKIQKIKKLL